MRLLFFLLSIFILSCKPLQQKEGIKNAPKEEITEPHIGFYFFKATKKENTYFVQLTEIKRVKGKIKGIFKDSIPSERQIDKNWLVSFQDLSKNTLIQQQIANPLVEHVEFVNDDTSLERKVIYHQEKVFIIRIPYNKSIKSIKFEVLEKQSKKMNTLFINKIDVK